MGMTRIHADGRRDEWLDQPLPDTTRTYSRQARDAFREWPENAIGIEGPVVIPLSAPWWVRLLRWLFRVE